MKLGIAFVIVLLSATAALAQTDPAAQRLDRQVRNLDLGRTTANHPDSAAQRLENQQREADRANAGAPSTYSATNEQRLFLQQLQQDRQQQNTQTYYNAD